MSYSLFLNENLSDLLYSSHDNLQYMQFYALEYRHQNSILHLKLLARPTHLRRTITHNIVQVLSLENETSGCLVDEAGWTGKVQKYALQ